ncbi:hypothetical protein BH10PSE1_BH10PSE1_07130 [soil metagenome]
MAIPMTSETLAIAGRVLWFEPPEQAMADITRFLAYAFRYATHPDMKALRRAVGDDALREALDNAPSGIIDARSWAYWRLMLDMPPKPLPSRSLG